MNRQATGLQRRSGAHQRFLSAHHPYHDPGTLLPLRTVFQRVFRIHAQPEKGDCAGEAITGRIEPHVKIALSGVDTWTDGRRRAGDLDNPNAGSNSYYEYESVVYRGVSSYVPGEETRSIEEDKQIASLAQELQADARRISIDAVHRTIVPADPAALAQLNDAMQRDYACMVGTGCNDAYQSLRLDDEADASVLDGSIYDGHMQGVLAHIIESDTRFPIDWRGRLLIQNSWTEEWGGVTLPCDVTCTDGVVIPAGTVLRGVIRARPSCYTSAWEHDCLEVQLAA